MRKNAKCLSIIILIFVLILINPLFSQTTNSVEKDIQSKGNYSFPANSSEIINKYSSQDKKLLPFVYNGFIYTFSVDRKLLLWKFFIGGDLENPFVLDNNQLFFFDIYNRLYSVDFIDGKLRWVKAIDNEIIGKPVIIKGSVVVITQNGRILVFSKSSGKLIELYDTKHEIAGGGNFYKDLMVVTFKEGMIIAYNIYTGKKVWQFINTGFISIKPIIDEGKLFFGTWDNNFYSLDLEKGKLLWINYIGSKVSRDFLIFKNSIILFLSDGEILSLDKQTGIINWVKYFKGIDFDYNYFKGIEKFYIFRPELVAYDPLSGSVLFNYRERVYKLYKDMLFDTMVEGKHFINEKEKESLLKNKYFVVNSYPVLPPINDNNLVYFVGEDSNLYIYDIKKDFFIVKYKLD